MTVLDRKLLRDLKTAKGSLLAILNIVAVGVACFVTMSSSYFNLDGARSRYYAQSRMADFWIDLKKMPTAEMDRLRQIPGVAELHYRISFQLTIDLEDEPKPLRGQIISLPDVRTPVLNDVVMVRGSYFSEDSRDQVIVNDAFAKARNLKPGDSIHVILNNRRHELNIVGTAISAEFVYLISPGSLVPDNENYGILYISQSHAEEVFDFAGASNQLIGRLDPRFTDTPELVLDRFERDLDPYGVAATTPLSRFPSHRFISDEINSLRVASIVMPGIFLSVAALVLNVLMTRMAEQQRTIIGTLKAIGYSNTQMTVHFLKFGTFIGLTGSLMGCLLGYLLAEGMIQIYRTFYEIPNLVNRPYPLIFGAGIATGVVFAVVGTLRGVHAVLKLIPAESMRPKPPPAARRVLLERITWLWKRIGFRWHIVVRDLTRQRGRTIAGIFAATMGAALMTLSFLSRDAVLFLVDFQFEQLLLSDFDLHLKDTRNYGSVFETEDLPGVEIVEPVFSIAGTFQNGRLEKRLAIQGIRKGATLTVPRDLQGKRVGVPPSGLLISQSLADLLELRPGDPVEFKPVEGNRDRKTLYVTQIVDGYLGMAAYADFEYLNRLLGEENAVATIQLKASSQMPTLAFYREVKMIPGLQAVAAIRDEKRNLESTLVETMKFSLTILILFAGVIFFGSILNSSLIALAERQREIATFRVVGYGPWDVGMIFFRESMLINALGTAIGIPLGFYLNTQMAKLYNTELFRFPVVLRVESVVWTIALAILFTAGAHAVIQWKIHQMDWRDALNVRE